MFRVIISPLLSSPRPTLSPLSLCFSFLYGHLPPIHIHPSPPAQMHNTSVIHQFLSLLFLIPTSYLFFSSSLHRLSILFFFPFSSPPPVSLTVSLSLSLSLLSSSHHHLTQSIHLSTLHSQLISFSHLSLSLSPSLSLSLPSPLNIYPFPSLFLYPLTSLFPPS